MKHCGKIYFCGIKTLSFQGPVSLFPTKKKILFVFSRAKVKVSAQEFLLHICTVQHLTRLACVPNCSPYVFQLAICHVDSRATWLRKEHRLM